ncbi:MAG: hypothetical protein ACI870_000471 [Crocinitomicaceae bacterium]|jgi:hypothetical protein
MAKINEKIAKGFISNLVPNFLNSQKKLLEQSMPPTQNI